MYLQLIFFFFFSWKAEFLNNFLFHVLTDVKFFFFQSVLQKYCVTVMEIWYDQVNRSSLLFWVDRIFIWGGKTQTKSKSFWEIPADN